MAFIDPATNKPRGAMDYVAFGTHDGTSGHLDALCHYGVQSEASLGEKQHLYNGFLNDLTLQGCTSSVLTRMPPAPSRAVFSSTSP